MCYTDIFFFFFIPLVDLRYALFILGDRRDRPGTKTYRPALTRLLRFCHRIDYVDAVYTTRDLRPSIRIRSDILKVGNGRLSRPTHYTSQYRSVAAIIFAGKFCETHRQENCTTKIFPTEPFIIDSKVDHYTGSKRVSFLVHAFQRLRTSSTPPLLFF